ncbi:MAG TPA: Plug domain-containing protein [Chitinophagaceae bacterium]|nr:Plug domain-containing protein [Chitinophagaceae bacterium]
MKKIILLFVIALCGIMAFGQRKYSPQASREKILNDEYCTGLFHTFQAQYFDMSSTENANAAPGYFNIIDWLKGRVAGLQVYSTISNVSIPYLRNQRASIYVNEMRVSYDYLSMLPVSDIALVKVMKGPFSSVLGSTGGTIAIYTFKGDEEEED